MAKDVLLLKVRNKMITLLLSLLYIREKLPNLDVSKNIPLLVILILLSVWVQNTQTFGDWENCARSTCTLMTLHDTPFEISILLH